MSTTGAIPPSPAVEIRPAGLLIRFAAATYEAILLFGVVFVITYALLALMRWTYPLSGFQRITLQVILFVILGVYFVYQWTRTGQTLAMKSWHLRLVGKDGKPPQQQRAALRYILAWHLLVPGALWIVVAGGRPALDLTVFLLGAGLLLLPARFDSQRRLLHDRFSATRIIRER